MNYKYIRVLAICVVTTRVALINKRDVHTLMIRNMWLEQRDYLNVWITGRMQVAYSKNEKIKY